MAHCILCGTGNDVWARYCAGFGCGADLAGLREGDPTRAVQVYGEPTELTARAGDLVETVLTIRNAGSAPDKYVLELRRDIGDRVTVERHSGPEAFGMSGAATGVLGNGLGPGESCTWTVRYAVPWDWSPGNENPGVEGLFDGDANGDPNTGAAGAGGGGSIVIPLRVVSVRDRRVAALTTLTVLSAAVPVPLAPDMSDAARKRSRETRFAAAGAGAAVAVVVALIVGMAAAGSGGGGSDRPAGLAAPTTGPPIPDGVSPPPGNEGIPTDLPSHSLSSPPTTAHRSSATPSRTSRPPSTRPPSTPAPDAPRSNTGRPGEPGTPTSATPSAPGTASPSGTPPESPRTSPPAPERVPVPSVMGLSYAEASAALEGAGFQVQATGTTSACRDDLSAPGCVVVGQSPRGRAVAGTVVSLSIGGLSVDPD